MGYIASFRVIYELYEVTWRSTRDIRGYVGLCMRYTGVYREILHRRRRTLLLSDSAVHLPSSNLDAQKGTPQVYPKPKAKKERF